MTAQSQPSTWHNPKDRRQATGKPDLVDAMTFQLPTSKQVITTAWGEWEPEDIPDNLRKRINSARITRKGLPDRRFKGSKTLWEETEAWAMSMYLVV